jgi:hypothetical protein
MYTALSATEGASVDAEGVPAKDAALPWVEAAVAVGIVASVGSGMLVGSRVSVGTGVSLGTLVSVGVGEAGAAEQADKKNKAIITPRQLNSLSGLCILTPFIF